MKTNDFFAPPRNGLRGVAMLFFSGGVTLIHTSKEMTGTIWYLD